MVDPVVQNPLLTPELQQLIAGLPEGKEVEFGKQKGIDQKKNVEEVKQEASGQVSSQKTDTEHKANAGTTTSDKQTAEQKAGQIGPFSGPMERLGYLTGTMKKAIGEWWTKNKITVIIGLVAGIAGLILANIATGGAIMAALPLLLQIVGAIFTGIGILDMAKHFGRYLSKAFPGNIAGGAKSLARGLAALTIELVFALLFGGKALLKSAKKGIKTVAKKGVKSAVKSGVKTARNSAVKGLKNTAQNFKDLGGVAKDGWGALMKNGRMVFNGAKRGVIKGAKSLDDVAKRLSKKFRFRKFKIQVKKRRFKLFGEFNPWVLLASGEVVEVDQKDLKNIDTPGGTARVGDKVKIGKKEGVLVGAEKSKSKYVQDLSDRTVTSKTKAAQEFLDLKNLDDNVDRVKAIRKSEGTAELRRGIGKLQPTDFQAHHVIPRELRKKFQKLFDDIGFHIENGKVNGIMIPPDKGVLETALKDATKKGDGAVKKAFGNSAFHKGSHPDYTKQIHDKLEELKDDFSMIANPNSAQKKAFLNEVIDVTKKAKDAIKAGNGKSINELMLNL